MEVPPLKADHRYDYLNSFYLSRAKGLILKNGGGFIDFLS